MVLLYIIFVSFYIRISAKNDPFPNDQNSRIDEWDRLPPTILVCLLARNKAHTLPYFLGSLEDLDYPKDRISLFIRTDHNIDDTKRILDRWVDAVDEFYHKIDYKVDEKILEGGYEKERGPFDWSSRERRDHVIKLKRQALETAKNLWADYILYIDCDVFFIKKRVLQALISTRQPVVSPFLTGPTNDDFSFTNFEIEEDNPDSSSKFDFIFQREQPDIYRVEKAKSCVLIDLLSIKSRQITFEMSKNMQNSATDDDLLFRSLKSLNLHYFLDNRLRYGWILPPMRQNLADLRLDEENLRFLLTENLNDGPGDDGLLYSPFVEPILPPKTKFGFDEIFLINLKRRPDRLTRMERILDILGIDFTVLEATDGKNLTDRTLKNMNIKPLAEFRDPYRNRLITKGEIGCFLSHYKIWRSMMENRYEKVLIFEDDLRFVRYARRLLENFASDLAKNVDFSWDLIYLGRKILKKEEENVDFKRGKIRNLAPVSYSYWTLGYALSLDGARKLLAPDPLQKLVPVDEYLPIMYDKHPDEKWKAHFDGRTLKAYTFESLLVHPVRYTGQEGYVSDTENADLVDQSLLAVEEKEEPKKFSTNRMSDEL